MTAIVLPFPVGDPARIRQRPKCLADLPKGAQALVIYAHRSGFNVVIRPFLTKKDEFAIRGFANAQRALDYARDLAIRNPQRFQLILDQTEGGSLGWLLPDGSGGAA